MVWKNPKIISLIVITCIVIINSGCRSLPKNSGLIGKTTETVSVVESADEWYSVYFTAPGSPEADAYEGGPGNVLADAIQSAKLSVDIAAYKLNLWEIRDALIESHRNGVVVRIVTDSENFDEEEVQELISAGIPVVHDHSDHLMHNKFVVIDRMEVWTGSMNPTLGGVFFDNNNLIRVNSSQLAGNYLVEFEEMFTEKSFSNGSEANTPHPTITINGSKVETLFSPDDGTAHRIIDLIEGADESVYFLAYSFTADDIAQAMIDRAHSDIDVIGVMEEGQYLSNTGTEFDRLIAGGIDVRLDRNPNNMHHKVIIIDETIVITGSYNFSASAENRNDENTLIIHNAAVANEYLSEFWRVYNEARP